MTPWQYLYGLVSSDRSPDMDEHWMTTKLQARWPGNYRVVKDIDYQWQYVEHKIVFDTPADETFFRLKYE